MSFRYIDKSDGRWWIKCENCDSDEGTIDLKTVQRSKTEKWRIDMDFEMVCAKCSGPIKFHRVEISGTVSL